MMLSGIAKSFVKVATFSLALAGLSQVAVAQDQIKVIKAKGNKGIVQFPKNITPKSGDTFTIGGGNESFAGSSEGSSGGGGASTGRRQYALGLSLGAAKKASSLGPNKANGSGDGFAFGLGARVKFNLDGSFEVGPSLLFSHSDAANIFGGGGFVEYNFIKNTPGTEFVPGIALQGLFTHTGVGEVSSSEIDADGTIFGKFFVLGASTACLRADVGAQYQKPMADGAKSEIGFGLSGGLEAYF